MAGKKTAVFGIYGTSGGAENAVDTLTTSGFPISDVSVLVPETLGSKDMGTEKATKAPEGAATGAGSGAVLGGTLGESSTPCEAAASALRTWRTVGPTSASTALVSFDHRRRRRRS